MKELIEKIERKPGPIKVPKRGMSDLERWEMILDRIGGSLKSGNQAIDKMKKLGGASIHEAVLMRATRDIYGEAKALIKILER